MELNTTPAVKAVFDKYPKQFQKKLLHIRALILETANEIEMVKELEETLKWGEPSYLAKKGSTIRIDWKPKKPDQYAIYFKCTSKLVTTFKEIYPKEFKYETTRAIYFNLDDKVPEKKLKHCIELALTYHHVKHLPRLGA